MVSTLADAASNAGKNNVAFLSHFILGDLEKCLDVLIESGRLPEAAFFARTYLPSQISKVLVCVCIFFPLFFREIKSFVLIFIIFFVKLQKFMFLSFLAAMERTISQGFRKSWSKSS